MSSSHPKSIILNSSAFLLLTTLTIANSIVQAAPTFGPQSSNKHEEWDFDFVEEFDGLQDWVRNDGKVGNVGASADPAEELNVKPEWMPKLMDGRRGAWGYYSQWSSGSPQQNWIDDYGDNRVWRGTKSAAISMSGPNGPSRFGLHMGEGYQEAYLFFMVNLPKNMWPTSCAGGSCKSGSTGSYTEGREYAWFSSFKFTTWNVDCEYEMCIPYSPYWHQIFHIQQYSYGETPGLTFHLEDPNHTSDYWAADAGTSLNSYVGDWFGIELHLTQTATQTVHDIWIYDQNGNAVKMVDQQPWSTPSAARNKNWNHFFFGGNNSNTYTWGSTMDPTYYIDDVIIDDKRIGPKYFKLIQGASKPLPPSNVNISHNN